MNCLKCHSQMNRYVSANVSGDGMHDLWMCPNGCDAWPMWMNFIAGSFLLLLIAYVVWH